MTITETLIYAVLKIAMLVPVIQLTVAYVVWLERKLLGHFQQRLGPLRVGPFGLLQPIADGLKLFLKEDIIPTNADRVMFIIAPFLTVFTSLVAIAVIPFGPPMSLFGFEETLGLQNLGSTNLQIADPNVGILYIFAITAVGIYGIFFAGWSSGNKYSLLGAMRSSAQMFSYELSMGLSIVPIIMAVGAFQLSEVVSSQAGGFWNWWFISPQWFMLPGFIAFITFLICIFAETNRTPFDLPEAETELVAGYHTEYSSMKFAVFFMAEYTNMITAASITTTLFLGGWHSPLPFAPFTLVPGVLWFALKVLAILVLFIWVRATLPRFRYDQLMSFGWKFMLPLTIINLFFAAVMLLLAEQVGL